MFLDINSHGDIKMRSSLIVAFIFLLFTVDKKEIKMYNLYLTFNTKCQILVCKYQIYGISLIITI